MDVLMTATIGVPLYACGGGTIPLLQAWLVDGMSIGSAALFMLAGPATQITNLGALKIVLGPRRFLLYIGFFVIPFPWRSGWLSTGLCEGAAKVLSFLLCLQSHGEAPCS